MSCCATAREEFPVSDMAEIIMLLKDSNSNSQYGTWIIAMDKVTDLLENINQYTKESRETIHLLLIDCNKRKKKLKENARRRSQFSRNTLEETEEVSMIKKNDEAKDALRRAQFLEQRERRLAKVRATV